MNHLTGYTCLDDFIFRCPIFSLAPPVSEDLNSELFREALFLASPDLYEGSASAGSLSGDVTNTRLLLSLTKYRIRMSSRCTPFGLFAGCGTGSVGASSSIVLKGLESFRTTTRLDMNFLCELVQRIGRMPEVSEKLLYFPNTSLYRLFDRYRFAEYVYAGGLRKHFLSEVEHSPELELLLEQAGKGATKQQLAEGLCAQDVDPESASAFVEGLIDSQVLVNQLDPGVTGDDLLTGIAGQLTALGTAPSVSAALDSIHGKLKALDLCPPGRRLHLYEAIEQDVRALDIPYVRKFLFQSDMSVQPISATLHGDVFQTVLDGFTALNHLTGRHPSQLLNRFREAFYKRYEEEEVPLAEALDSDIGIGFGTLTPGSVDIHPLLDGIPRTQTSADQKTHSAQEIFMFEKYLSSIQTNSREIEITAEDLSRFTLSWDDLPVTLSSLIEVVKAGPANDHLIVMTAAGHCSAGNLLSRFCHANPQIHQQVRDIISIEEDLYPADTIVAEIVHLPESRIGNIVFRPPLRTYEIPYLAKPSVPPEFQLPISDLMVSVSAGKHIRIRSKKLGKAIIPKLTTAHSFASNSLPVYHFLCSLQADGIRPSVHFQWGSLVGNKPFLPRVRYKNAILSPATWNIRSEENRPPSRGSGQEVQQQMMALRQQYNLPDKVWLTKGDNKLLIDFNDDLSVRLLHAESRDQPIVLEEYLMDANDTLILDDSGKYANEIIVCLYKNKPQPVSHAH